MYCKQSGHTLDTKTSMSHTFRSDADEYLFTCQVTLTFNFVLAPALADLIDPVAQVRR